MVYSLLLGAAFFIVHGFADSLGEGAALFLKRFRKNA